MEIRILKCDRCKQKVNELINFQFVNTNVPDDNNGGDDDNISNKMWSIFPKRKEYPTIQGGLCQDCIQIISKWLGHPENELTKV